MSSQPAPPTTAPSQRAQRLSYADVQPKKIDTEDASGDDDVLKAWDALYKLVGATDEKRQMGVRSAVYVYGLVNATSREGLYKGHMEMFDGTKFPAAYLPRAIGKMDIRRFFRANMLDSYEALKETDLHKLASRHVAKCANLAIGYAEVPATADWLDHCPLFTPAEALAHERFKNRSIDRARRARNGHTLESVEAARVEKSLSVQGSEEPVIGAIDF